MKFLLRIMVILLVGVTMISCSKDEPKNTKTGSIYGMVTDSDTGEPMRATGVELYYYGSLLLKTVTYDDGHFEFESLKAGDYELKVAASGYEDEFYNVVVERGRTARADMQLRKLDTYMTVRTEGVEAHTGGTAVFKGDYTYKYNGYDPDEYGFIYGQNPNLSINSGTTVKSDSKMTVEVTGLQKGVWYVRAYAKNKVGYAFGNVLKFEISGNPEVSTQAVSNITDDTATLNGLIVYNGDPEYTEKGFVYSSSFPNPTIDDPQSATTTVVVSGKSKEFSANIADLVKDKTYYVRAYAKGSVETVYGTTVSFVATSYIPYVIIDNIAVQLSDLSQGTNFSSANDICSNSRVGGFSDWRLPTLGELSLMYANKAKIKGFADDLYWSSTFSRSLVTGIYYFALNFLNGKTDDPRIDSYCRVRAVRTIK